MNGPTLHQVIDLDGKEFTFTWSREFGDLCDIYEERESGESGNGLLVESGCAWRKVNVQRILDESTKNHVKMRSEEAERKNKTRKYVIWLLYRSFFTLSLFSVDIHNLRFLLLCPNYIFNPHLHWLLSWWLQNKTPF